MISPLQNFVLLEVIKEELSSTIYVPEDVDREPSIKGKIIAIGDGVTLPISVGDTVLFKDYGFEPIEVDKTWYIIGEAKHIFAKI